MNDLVEIFDPLAVLGRHLGQFRIGAGIAAVRSGRLYVGRDLANQKKQVWIQFFDTRRAELVACARRQAEVWAALDDHSFSRIIGFEAEPDSPPLVAFDPVAGMFVSERLASGVMPPVDAVALIIDAARGLARAHARGLAHLGLSEDTVLLAKDDSGRARVIGLGLPAAFCGADALGWHYLAPEQLASQSDCDHRADIYALGILLFRCVTENFPVELPAGTAADRLAGMLLLGEQRDPREWLEPQFEALAAVIRRATHRDRAERYQTAEELALALQHSGLVLPAHLVPEQTERHHVQVRAPESAQPILRAAADQKTHIPAEPNSDGKSLRVVTPDSGSDDPLIGQVLCDLRFERRLAEGGGGAVYYAINAAALNRSRVVKVLFEANAERFRQEALIMRQLKEANVPRVVDIYRLDQLPNGQWFLEMEYVRGRELHQTLTDDGRIDIFRALKIIDSLSDTLEIAHRHGIVHRDIKPSNILMEETHGRQTHKLRVLDWGIARGSGDVKVAVTRAKRLFGTPGYMSPQAWMEMPLDGRADVFAVAVIMYEMLVGKRLFDGENTGAICKATLELDPPRVSVLRPEVRKSVSDLVAAGLEKDVEKRPTMAEFRARLNEIMVGWNGAKAGGGVVRAPMNTLLSSAVPAPLPLPQKPTQTPAPAPADRAFQQRLFNRAKSRRARVLKFVGAAVVVTMTVAITAGVVTRRAKEVNAPKPALPVATPVPLGEAPVEAPPRTESVPTGQPPERLRATPPAAANRPAITRRHRATHHAEAPEQSPPQPAATVTAQKPDEKSADDSALAPLPQH